MPILITKEKRTAIAKATVRKDTRHFLFVNSEEKSEFLRLPTACPAEKLFESVTCDAAAYLSGLAIGEFRSAAELSSTDSGTVWVVDSPRK